MPLGFFRNNSASLVRLSLAFLKALLCVLSLLYVQHRPMLIFFLRAQDLLVFSPKIMRLEHSLLGIQKLSWVTALPVLYLLIRMRLDVVSWELQG